MSSTKIRHSLPTISLVLIVIAILASTFLMLQNHPHPIADEVAHALQIRDFYNGKFKIRSELTVTPAYHAVIAGLLLPAESLSITLGRFVHLLFSALAIPVFYQICKTLKQPNPDTRTLLFLSCPIILPFFSVIYTDIPALLAVLVAFLLTIKKRYLLAALIGLVAILFRQTNLVWVAFCCSFILIEHLREFRFEQWRQQFLPLTRKLWPFAVVAVAAVVSFSLRDGIALGEPQQHQISLNLSNLYFFLLLSFFLFLPHNIANAKQNFSLLKTAPKVWLIWIPAFAIYMTTYSNNHQYNSFTLPFFLRNQLLHYTVTPPIWRAVAFIPIAWMAITLYFFYKRSDDKWLIGALYLFGLLSFVPLPLVEQRYYITMLTLLYAIMPPRHNARLDWAALLLFIPINCALLLLISRNVAFL